MYIVCWEEVASAPFIYTNSTGTHVANRMRVPPTMHVT